MAEPSQWGRDCPPRPGRARAAGRAGAGPSTAIPGQSIPPPSPFPCRGALPPQLLLDTAVYDSIPNITVPVLLVAGADDELIPAQNSRDLAGRLTQPWLAVYPHAGHAVFAQYRDDILDLVGVFLDQ